MSTTRTRQGRLIRTGSMNLRSRLRHWLKAVDLFVHQYLSPRCKTTFTSHFVHCDHERGCPWALSSESWRLR